jgi:hypothetical protein
VISIAGIKWMKKINSMNPLNLKKKKKEMLKS